VLSECWLFAFLVEPREMVVRLCEAGLNPYCLPIVTDGFGLSRFVLIQQPEFEVSVGEVRFERHGFQQMGFGAELDGFEIDARIPFAQAYRVVVIGLAVRGIERGKACEPLGYLICVLRGNVVHLSKEIERLGVFGIEIDCSTERLHCGGVLSQRIVGNPQADTESWRGGVALHTEFKNFKCGSEGAMFQQIAAEVEDIFLGRIEAGGGFIFTSRFVDVTLRLLQVSKQVVQISLVFSLDERLDDVAALLCGSCLEVDEREVVTVDVIRGIDFPGFFEIRDGGRVIPGAYQVFAGEVIGLEAVGMKPGVFECGIFGSCVGERGE